MDKLVNKSITSFVVVKESLEFLELKNHSREWKEEGVTIISLIDPNLNEVEAIKNIYI